MGPLQYTLKDYVAYVLTSHRKKLLVEGPDDHRLFLHLLTQYQNDGRQIDIDDASSLIGFEPPIGNREKVERVCSAVKGNQFSDKLVGFVDREFRGFASYPYLQDDIKAHYVDDRLVWTRGHSIENYFFDFETVYEPILMLSTTLCSKKALKLLEANFERVIRFACIFSLIGCEINNYEVIKSSVSWNLFSLNDNTIHINLRTLQQELEAKHLQSTVITQVLACYNYGEELVMKADYETVRWFCHGHIGLKFIWAAFARFVAEISAEQGNTTPLKEVQHALQCKEDVRFNACSHQWVSRSRAHDAIFPFEVLTMLKVIK